MHKRKKIIVGCYFYDAEWSNIYGIANPVAAARISNIENNGFRLCIRKKD